MMKWTSRSREDDPEPPLPRWMLQPGPPSATGNPRQAVETENSKAQHTSIMAVDKAVQFLKHDGTR